MNSGANPQAKNKDGNTPLDIAAKQPDLNKEVIALLMHSSKSKSLSIFVQVNDIKGVKSILTTRKSDVNIFDKNGLLPLHYAAKLGHTDIAIELMRSGARPDILVKQFEESKQDSAFYFASRYSQTKTFNAMFKYWGNTSFKEREKVLLYAVLLRNFEMCRIILESDDEMKVKINDVYHGAQSYGSNEIIQLFQSHGMKLSLFGACKMGDATTTKKLLVDGANADKDFPIHHAITARSLACVKLLIQAKCKTEAARRSDGIYPIALAAKLGEYAIVEYLLKNGAKVNSTDYLFDNAIVQALNEKHYKVAELLLKNGVDINMTSESKGEKVDLFGAYKHDKQALRLLRKYKK